MNGRIGVILSADRCRRKERVESSFPVLATHATPFTEPRLGEGRAVGVSIEGASHRVESALSVEM